jgi:hypothetical protein
MLWTVRLFGCYTTTDPHGRWFPRAFDCQNASGPDLGFAPPCVEQGPFSLPGFTGDFPQLHRAP